ncbi:hypothetical protein Q9L58_008063 [Maublancomyces gigas]|uniref:MARVEL domain-containing protein n=1 Tax=Discina gigas TaxID=1032678 RepID=A0ABR3GB60_9PEZI
MASSHKPQGAEEEETPVSGGNELEKPFLPGGPDNHSRLERRDARLKRQIRYLKFVSRLLGLMMSGVVVGMMINTTVSYFGSRTTTIDGLTPWPTSPKIWPTFMMMSVSALGLLTNAVVVISYISGQKAANDASSVASFFSGLSILTHLVVWAVAAGLFKQQNATNGVENDLWSWSCSTTADARAEAFKEVVNYDFLCKSNFTSWYISLANVGLGIISIVLYGLAMARVRSKKKLRQAQAARGV